MSKKGRQLDRRGFFESFFRPWIHREGRPPDGLADILPQTRALLRPPGALPEREFLETCFHSGNCVDSCPVEAIQTYLGEDEALRGTPFIDPDRQPCVLCDSLACMVACPSGALRLVERDLISMGWAIWQVEACRRTRGDPCAACVDRCPLGEKAIRLTEEGQIEVSRECVGCGVCQHVCPDGAIQVTPT